MKLSIVIVMEVLCKLVSSNLLSDELRFRSFGKETSPLARALIEDKNHNIWIGSETDITLFDVHDQTFESFGETFFNRSFNYSECLPVTDRQGDILMGTEGGMLVFSRIVSLSRLMKLLL